MAFKLHLTNSANDIDELADDWNGVRALVFNYLYGCGLPLTANESAVLNCTDNHDPNIPVPVVTWIVETVEV